MARNITRLLIIAIYMGALFFFLGQFVGVFLFVYDYRDVLGRVGMYTIEVTRSIALLTTVVAYVGGVLWSKSQIAKATYLTDYQKVICKKMVLTKPFTGLAIYYLTSSISRTKTLFLDKRVIGAFYYGREASVVLFFLGGLAFLSIPPTELWLVAFAGMIPLVIVMHVLFEISILLTILEKGDQEIANEEHYFNVIQYPLQFSKYYRNNLANKDTIK